MSQHTLTLLIWGIGTLRKRYIIHLQYPIRTPKKSTWPTLLTIFFSSSSPFSSLPPQHKNHQDQKHSSFKSPKTLKSTIHNTPQTKNPSSPTQTHPRPRQAGEYYGWTAIKAIFPPPTNPPVATPLSATKQCNTHVSFAMLNPNQAATTTLVPYSHRHETPLHWGATQDILSLQSTDSKNPGTFVTVKDFPFACFVLVCRLQYHVGCKRTPWYEAFCTVVPNNKSRLAPP